MNQTPTEALNEKRTIYKTFTGHELCNRLEAYITVNNGRIPLDIKITLED